MFCVSHRRQPAPAAERLGAHTVLIGRWEVGRIAPNISSNVEAIVLTFRGNLLHVRKLRVYEKTLVSVIVLAKKQFPFPIRCQNCGFTDAARTRLHFDQQKISKRLFDEPQGAPPQGWAIGGG